MNITRRARRRFLLLVCFLVGGSAIISTAWYVRQYQKEVAATGFRATGMAAVAERNWPVALDHLSKAVAFDKRDIEALLGLADARSRIPDGNTRHLTTAMTLYGRACNLAENSSAPPEVLQRALAGRARMELACGAIANLEDTARELLVISPEDQEAISYMLEINKVKGNILPGSLRGDELDLLVRGDRTDRAWLEAMSMAEDDSVFRWSLARLVTSPEDLALRDGLLVLLREGGADDLQRLRVGSVIQSSRDLIAAWRADGSVSEEMADLLLASELIRDRDLDEARAVLLESEARGFTEPEILLRAASLFDVLGGADDNAASARIMAQVKEFAHIDSEIAMEVASRAWGEGKPREALELLDAAMEQEEVNQRLDVAVIAMAIAILSGSDEADSRLESAKELLEESRQGDGSVEGEARFIELGEIALKEEPDGEEISTAYTIVAAMSSNALLQTIFGDILDKAGLNEAATTAWARAGRIAGYRAMPIGQRAIRGYLRAQAVDKAFAEAFNYVSMSPSLSAVLLFCEAWLALEAAGLDPETVVPQLRTVTTGAGEGLTPLSLLLESRRNLQNAEASTDPVLPTLARAALLEERLDLFEEVMEEAVEKGQSSAVLTQLIALDRRVEGSDYAWRLLDRMKELGQELQSSGRIIAVEATMLRDQGRIAEASTLVDSALEEDPEPELRNLLELERLANLRAAGAASEKIAAQLELLIGLESDPSGLSRLHLAVLELAEEAPEAADSLSQRVVDRTVVTSGENSTPFALALARHILEFDSEEQAVRNAILVVDPHTAPGGNAGIELKMALVALLQNSNPPQLDRAIDVMEALLLDRPGRFDIAVALTDLLQRAGRYDEAGARIQDLSRRRAFAPAALQAAIPRLVAGQGDSEAVAESLCDFAEQTGRTIDRLECAKALFAAGDAVAGLAMLEELRLDPERPVEVDVALAGRLVRAGRFEEGLDLLKTTDRFPSEVRRDLAIGAILLQLRRNEELGSLLERWSPQELAGHVAAAPAESEERDRRVASAANLEVLRASHLLRRQPNDPVAASAALDRAVELQPERIEILVRNATMRLESGDLRSTAPPAIQLVAEVNPRLADMMTLAVKASPDGVQFQGDAELIRQAKEVVALNPQNRAAYTLALNIMQAALRESMRGSDFSLITERYETLVDMARSTMDRFPADQESPVLLSNIYMEGGEWEEALMIAREGANRAGRGSRIENMLPIAQIEVQLGRYGAAFRTLAPFRDQIETEISRLATSSPRNAATPRGRLWLQTWRLLVTAAMCDGQVEYAWDLVRKMPPNDPRTLGTFIQAMESADASIALEAAALVQASPIAPNTRLLLVGALNSVHRRTGDEGVRTLAQEQLNPLRSNDASAARLLQLGLLEISLGQEIPPVETVFAFLDLLDTVPPMAIEALKDRENLPEASRQQLLAMFNPLVIVLNNSVAMGADVVLSGEASIEESNRILARIGKAAADLEALTRLEVAEVNDTLAMAALAEGRIERAIELARMAIEMAPLRSGFRLGLAKALLRNGDTVEARSQGLQARRLHNRLPVADPALEAKIDAFMQEVDSQG